MSRYVVTGAAGFIGSHLTESLLAAGHEVVAIDCFTDHYDSEVKEENAAAFLVERIDLSGDPLDFGGVDGVFHLAAQPGVRSFGDRFPLYLRNNVLASERVFDAAARAGAATEAAMAAGTGTYNVGGGTVASMLEAIGILERLAESSLEVVHAPAVPGDQRRTSADTTRIRTEPGWEPQISLEDGLAAQWEWASGRVATR